MTQKTFSVAGTSTNNGITKIRFANDFVGRLKILYKNGHENVELMELGRELTKAQICQVLMSHPKYQTDEQQDAIYEFVLRNCKEIKAEIETREYKHVDIATAVHTLEEIMETAGAGDPGSNGEASGTDRPLLPPPVHPQ